MNRNIVVIMAIGFFLVFSSFMKEHTLTRERQYDIVIYGATSAGVAAAIQSSRMGKSVLLIEPSARIGGLTTGGLGQTDISKKIVIGGISREFYQGIYAYYDDPSNWKWQKQSEYKGGGIGNPGEVIPTMWKFEPSAALQVYNDMLANEKVKLVTNKKLNRTDGVRKNGATIYAIEMLDGTVYRGKMFIDATYEGDLMAAAGVSYTLGRESNSEYGETLNGVQANNFNLTLKRKISRNAHYHNFLPGVDPYIVKGDPSSGLLPNINLKPGLEGQGDDKIQAYCFRMCLTDVPENRIPFKKPDNYNALDYELLLRNYEARKGLIKDMHSYSNLLLPWINAKMPNRKTDTNNKFGFSTDYIGRNYEYPEASYEEREKIAEEHRNYQMGLMWTLANHPRIPEEVRDIASQWGMTKDEFERGDGWQDQLYVREARRMISDYVMTQHNCERIIIVDDPVGLASYPIDSHHVQRYVDANGYVQNEGNVAALRLDPFPVSYRSIIPTEREATNLVVPVCLSSTHVAFGSIRMEPVFMVLGQSAAIAASLAIDENVNLQDLEYAKLKTSLLENKQRLKWEK